MPVDIPPHGGTSATVFHEMKEHQDASLETLRELAAMCCTSCGIRQVMKEYIEWEDGTLEYVRDTQVCCECTDPSALTLSEYKEFEDGTREFVRDTGACCECDGCAFCDERPSNICLTMTRCDGAPGQDYADISGVPVDMAWTVAPLPTTSGPTVGHWLGSVVTTDGTYHDLTPTGNLTVQFYLLPPSVCSPVWTLAWTVDGWQSGEYQEWLLGEPPGVITTRWRDGLFHALGSWTCTPLGFAFDNCFDVTNQLSFAFSFHGNSGAPGYFINSAGYSHVTILITDTTC